MLPPRLIRRLVVAPLVVAFAVVLVALFPALAVLAAGAGLLAQLFRRPRPDPPLRGLRLLWFTVVWFSGEAVALGVSLGLWVASGFGRRMHTGPYQRRTYATIRWFLARQYRCAVRYFGLTIEVREPEVTLQERRDELSRPAIVLSRHAGPGDSVLVLHYLLSVYHRRPRLVMKAALQLDPTLDVTANRIPNVFISQRGRGEHSYTDEIERLACGLDRDGALVIFPEGGNWTPTRWRRGIARLTEEGRPDLAARAQEMPNLLPPQSGGVMAAINARPDADVIFLAHAGLDGLFSAGAVWRDLPPNPAILAQYWRVPCDEVPRSEKYEVQLKWLYDWWQRIDAWITEHRPAAAPGTPPVPEAAPVEAAVAAEIVSERAVAETGAEDAEGTKSPLADGSASAAAPS